MQYIFIKARKKTLENRNSTFLENIECEALMLTLLSPFKFHYRKRYSTCVIVFSYVDNSSDIRTIQKQIN